MSGHKKKLTLKFSECLIEATIKIISVKFIMSAKFCTYRLERLAQLVHLQRSFVLTFCVFNFIFSFVATFGNLLIIRALWKTSSISLTLKKLFLSLAFSDLGVGLIGQLLYGCITAIMLKMAANEDYNYDFLCPRILTAYHFFLFLFACASFLNVTAIAVDRLLAISLHLRYQELVTSKRVFIALVSLWTTSSVAASIHVSLHTHVNMVAPIIEFAGLLLTTVAYIYIFRAVRYHQNEIHSQLQFQNAQAIELLREKKSAFNVLFVYVVFITCFLPHFCSSVLLVIENPRISFRAAGHATIFFVLFNSSLNPLVYCWRYRDIRQVVKSTVTNVFRISKNLT